MNSPGRGGIARRMALEALAWYAAAGTFLAAYSTILGASSAAIGPHLRLVTEAFVALAALRLALSALLPRHLARFASSFLAIAGFAVLLAYYATVVVSLRSWGRVIGWDMVESYAPQAALLLDALGVSAWVAVLAVAAIAAALLGLGWLHARRMDWVDLLASRTARVPRGLAAVALFVVATVDLHEYLIVPPLGAHEPVSLTFFSTRSAIRMQSHGVDRAAAERRDHEDDAARDAYRPSAAATRRNVIIIVGDALRSDHMGVYGYRRETTPNLARLRDAGVLRAAPPMRTICSESFCGMLGMAGSRYVHQFSGRMFMLPEVLKRNGYRTMMILAGDHTHFHGLREMYGPVDSYFDGSSATGHYINDDQLVIEQVNKLPEWDGRPMMLQIVLMSSHMLGKRHDAYNVYAPAANYFFIPNRVPGDDGKTFEKAVNFYDNGVRQLDAVVETLLDILRRKRYLEGAVVAITGDHGEALGEHGLWGHQVGITDEVVRVPFLLLSYGYRPKSALDPSAWPSQIDIAPTIVAELDIAPPATWTGVALQGPVRRDFIHFEQGPMLGLLDTRDVRSPWKYWEDRSDGRLFAFNLAQDPQELRNAVHEVPAQLLRDWQRTLVPIKAQYVAEPWKIR